MRRPITPSYRGITASNHCRATSYASVIEHDLGDRPLYTPVIPNQGGGAFTPNSYKIWNIRPYTGIITLLLCCVRACCIIRICIVTNHPFARFCETRSKSYMGRTFLPIVICHLAIFPPGSWKFVKTTLFRTSTYQHLHKKCYARSGHNQHDHDFSIVQHGSRYLRKCCKIQEIAIFEVYSLKLPAWQTLR